MHERRRTGIHFAEAKRYIPPNIPDLEEKIMCEFKIRKTEGAWSGAEDRPPQIAQDIILFRYSGDGERAVFSDILGRTVEMGPILVTEVNMLPRGHDITILESPVVERLVPFLAELERCRKSGGATDALRERLDALVAAAEAEVSAISSTGK
ncbi:MAG: hypothetical protein ACTSU5_09645 [Promethearchaeota archaeon]